MGGIFTKMAASNWSFFSFQNSFTDMISKTYPNGKYSKFSTFKRSRLEWVKEPECFVQSLRRYICIVYCKSDVNSNTGVFPPNK